MEQQPPREPEFSEKGFLSPHDERRKIALIRNVAAKEDDHRPPIDSVDALLEDISRS